MEMPPEDPGPLTWEGRYHALRSAYERNRAALAAAKARIALLEALVSDEATLEDAFAVALIRSGIDDMTPGRTAAANGALIGELAAIARRRGARDA
jgi:hypothetical protein